MESLCGHSSINTPQDAIATLALLLLNKVSCRLIKCQSVQTYFGLHSSAVPLELVLLRH